MPAWWVLFGYIVSGTLGALFLLMVLSLFRLRQVSISDTVYTNNGASSTKSNPLYQASGTFGDKQKLLSGF